MRREGCAGRRLYRFPVSDQEFGDGFDRSLRGREADANWCGAGHCLESLQRQSQVRTALVRYHGVDFIYDHGSHIAKNLAALLRREQQVERFRGRDQNVGRPAQHLLTSPRGRIAGADHHADLGHQPSGCQRRVRDLSEGLLQIFLNVVAERLQRRDVNHLSAIFEFTSKSLLEQDINAGEKGSQRFAGAGWRGDQDIRPGRNGGPTLGLYVSG